MTPASKPPDHYAEHDGLPRQLVRNLRERGWSFYSISRTFGFSLTECRRLADDRAARLHEQWRRD